MIKVDWKKAGMVALGVALVVLLIFNIKSCIDAKSERDAIRQDLIEMKRLSDQVVRNQSEYVSKEDLNKFGENLGLNLDEIKNDLANNDAKMVAISKALSSSLGRRQTGVPSSWTRPNPNPNPNPVVVTCPDGSEQLCEDVHGFLANSQGLTLSEPFPNVEVPIGGVVFEAWKEDPWTIDIHPRDYHITTVLGQDRNGRHYAYNKFEIGVDGKRYLVQIDDAQIKEVLPEPEFSWWNPRVGLGFHGGVAFDTSLPTPDADVVSATVGPTISFSPFSYGRLDSQPDWVFARVGVGIDAVHRSAVFSLAPAMWNIGSKVEFIQNTYLGPVITVDHQGRVGGGIGFTTDF